MRHYITAALINCRFSVTRNCSFTKKHYLGRENSVRLHRQLLKAAKRWAKPQKKICKTMNDIVKFNLKKFKFIFFFTSILFIFLTSILLVIAAISDQFPNFNLLITIALGSVIILPLFISLVAISMWFVKYKQQRRFFNNIMESHILPIGFHREILNLKSRWKFADEVYKLETESWRIVLSQNNHKASEMEFTYFSNKNHMNTEIEKVFNIGKKEIKNMNAESLKSSLLKNAFN